MDKEKEKKKVQDAFEKRVEEINARIYRKTTLL